jgi:hypothetical protein
MFNLTINSTNVANSLNNMYQYQFKNGAFEVPANVEMMITSFQIPYSWYNITSRYNNNSFKIYWPNGAVDNYTAYTLTLDDGFYTVNVLNARIQQFCIKKGMYLTDGSGNNVYYVSITPSSTAYANQIITKLVPSSLPVGYVAPKAPAFAGYPTTTRRPPYIEILSNNNFGKFLGFTSGNYGITKTTDYNVFKKQLMDDKMYKERGFGISSLESRPQMHLSNNYSGGTISHRAVVGPLIPDIGSLSIVRKKSGTGRNRKIYDNEKIGQGKKFNSLKFNF